MENEEIWKEIEGFNGAYLVSSHGRVKSCDRLVRYQNGFCKKIKSRILKPSPSSSGYPAVSLPTIGKINHHSTRAIHRLVAEAFLDNPSLLPCVNHRDGNKTNNHLSNLEWCSYGQNSVHAVLMGKFKHVRHAKGEDAGHSKLKEWQVLKIRQLAEHGELTHKQISEIFLIDSSAVSRILNRKTWKHL
jgi:hypothetical protein